MTTVFKGVNYTKAFITDNAKIPQGDAGGKLKCAVEEFTFAVAFGIGDTVLGPKLPAGARVHNAVISSASTSTDGIFELGFLANGVDSADSNAFVDAADAGGQAVTKQMVDSPNLAGHLKLFTVPTQVVLTGVEATTATSGTVKFAVYYTLD